MKTEQITGSKWNWIGHTLQKEDVVKKEAMEWNPQGQRTRGRPKRSWQRTIGEQSLAAGKMWEDTKQLSKNRVR
jgi:hypothetical protein